MKDAAKVVSKDSLDEIWALYKKYQPYLATEVYEFGESLKGLINNVQTVEAYPFEQVQELVKLNQQFAQEIENLKRARGKWILQYRSCGDEFYTCSVCGRSIEVPFDQDISNFPFCHCGADMRGKEE